MVFEVELKSCIKNLILHYYFDRQICQKYVTHVNTKTTFFQSSIGKEVFAKQLKLIVTFTLNIRCFKSGYPNFSSLYYLMKKKHNYIKLPAVKSASRTEIDK